MLCSEPIQRKLQRGAAEGRPPSVVAAEGRHLRIGSEQSTCPSSQHSTSAGAADREGCKSDGAFGFLDLGAQKRWSVRPFKIWECGSDGVLVVLRCGNAKCWSADRFEMWESKSDGMLIVLRCESANVMECWSF